MTNYHYIRVSSHDQNTDRQEVTTPTGYVQVIEQASGRTQDRPALTEMLTNLAIGDTVLVNDISRLARSLKDLNELVTKITSKGVSLRFEREGLEFSGDKANPTNQLMLNVIGAIYQFEVDIKKDRQREGIEAAKAKNVYKGRSADVRRNSSILELHKEGMSQRNLAKELDCSLSTVQRIIKANKD